jgi:hypothetical protein
LAKLAAEPVVRGEEKAVVLHKEVRAAIPMKPGSVAKPDIEGEPAENNSDSRSSNVRRVNWGTSSRIFKGLRRYRVPWQYRYRE